MQNRPPGGRGLPFWVLDYHTPMLVPGVTYWARWFEWASRNDRRRVGLTKFPNYDRYVSTVFLGIDHGFNNKVPLLFETMMLDHEGMDQDMMRYATWEEAQIGHDMMVAKARKMILSDRIMAWSTLIMAGVFVLWLLT